MREYKTKTDFDSSLVSGISYFWLPEQQNLFNKVKGLGPRDSTNHTFLGTEISESRSGKKVLMTTYGMSGGVTKADAFLYDSGNSPGSLFAMEPREFNASYPEYGKEWHHRQQQFYRTTGQSTLLGMER